MTRFDFGAAPRTGRRGFAGRQLVAGACVVLLANAALAQPAGTPVAPTPAPVEAAPPRPVAAEPQPATAAKSEAPKSEAPKSEALQAERPQATARSTQDRAKEWFKAGAAAYAAGDYLAAIQALEAAYALTPAPQIAFSIAQAERRQYFVDRRPEHLSRAVALFRRYIAEVPSGGRRTDAVDALAQLEPLASAGQEPANEVTPAPSSAPSDRRARIMVMSDTPGVRISIDGVEPGASPLIREVSPGEHQIELRADGYRDASRAIEAVAGELVPISVNLAALPGRLRLSAPLEADVYVDGAFVSQGKSPLVLDLPSGRHQVSVAEKGYRVATEQLTLGHGETRDTHFELSPTPQRLTSNALLIGGAVTIGAGVAFSLLALHAESDARAFLRHQSRGNVSPAELVGYQADVATRNRFRWIGGAMFASSLGLLITGLFLHELDTPSAEDIYRAVPVPDGASPRLGSDHAAGAADRLSVAGDERLPKRHFDVGAWLAPGQLGASFRTDF
jgi:hypothetical protein